MTCCHNVMERMRSLMRERCNMIACKCPFGFLSTVSATMVLGFLDKMPLLKRQITTWGSIQQCSAFLCLHTNTPSVPLALRSVALLKFLRKQQALHTGSLQVSFPCFLIRLSSSFLQFLAICLSIAFAICRTFFFMCGMVLFHRFSAFFKVCVIIRNSRSTVLLKTMLAMSCIIFATFRTQMLAICRFPLLSTQASFFSLFRRHASASHSLQSHGWHPSISHVSFWPWRHFGHASMQQNFI